MSRTINLTAGDKVYLSAVVTEDNGLDISGDTFQISLGTYETAGDWQTPDVIDPIATGSVRVKLLLGDAYSPIPGTYWPWIRVVDDPETESVNTDERITIV